MTTGPITGTLTARKVHDEPPTYRVWFDDGTGELSVGSIVERQRHVPPYTRYWHWGVDTFPLAKDSPNGDASSFGEARDMFRREFLRWINDLPPGSWQRNRDHAKAAATRHLRR